LNHNRFERFKKFRDGHLARDGLSANDVVDGAYSAASKCDRLVALKAYMNVEGDDGLMRTVWTGDRENPLMGQALLSAG
jgi:hypothetical protein